MITIAVAGGTGSGIGRAIVTAIQSYPDKLKAIVLGRKTSPTPKWLEDMTNVPVRKVDYTSQDELVTALEGIHTVICTLLAIDGTWASTQISLLNASLTAGVQRFAPAEFGCGPLAAPKIPMLQPQIAIIEACRAAKSQRPDFEFAGFYLGLFMNYLGYGAKDQEGALNGLNDTWVFIWDIKNMKARIPLTKEGSIPRATLMEIGDVGRFVTAACLLPPGQWKDNFGMVGETLRLDEVVKIVGRVRGRKMDVEYRTYEEVVEEANSEEAVHPNQFWAQLEEMVARDQVGEGVVEPVVNRLCPQVKAMGVEEYIDRFWGE